MRSTIKINPDLGYRKTRQGKTLAIVLEIDLLHRHLGILVKFQLYQVKTRFRHNHDINPAIRSMYFYIYHPSRKKREDDIEHLLIMPLIVRIGTIWNRAQESLQILQGQSQVFLIEGSSSVLLLLSSEYMVFKAL